MPAYVASVSGPSGLSRRSRFSGPGAGIANDVAELFWEKLANQGPFFGEFFYREIDFLTAEIVDWDALNDLRAAIGGADGERRHETFFYTVATIGTDGHAVPVACGGRTTGILGT